MYVYKATKHFVIQRIFCLLRFQKCGNAYAIYICCMYERSCAYWRKFRSGRQWTVNSTFQRTQIFREQRSSVFVLFCFVFGILFANLFLFIAFDYISTYLFISFRLWRLTCAMDVFGTLWLPINTSTCMYVCMYYS